eukprot:2368260-Prymnesium_polylepis.1
MGGGRIDDAVQLAKMRGTGNSSRFDVSQQLQDRISQYWQKQVASTSRVVMLRQELADFLKDCAFRAMGWADTFMPVINPEEAAGCTFTVLSAMTSVYIAVMIPIEVAFDDTFDPDGDALVAFNVLVDVICILRILATAHTGISVRGIYLGLTKEVWQQYTKDRVG